MYLTKYSLSGASGPLQGLSVGPQSSFPPTTTLCIMPPVARFRYKWMNCIYIMEGKSKSNNNVEQAKIMIGCKKREHSMQEPQASYLVCRAAISNWTFLLKNSENVQTAKLRGTKSLHVLWQEGCQCLHFFVVPASLKHTEKSFCPFGCSHSRRQWICWY